MKLGDSAAYPSDFDSNCAPEFGMSLRQYYAGLAMQAMLSSEYFSDFCRESLKQDEQRAIADVAVSQADALLKELEK